MSNERNILCGDVSESNLLFKDKKPIHLHLWGLRRNVTLSIDDIRSMMLRDVPSQFLDLLEIATYIYCADQAVSRGGDGVGNLGANWRRRLFFRIPVRHPDFWAEIKETLSSTLGFLTEDEFFFEFVKLEKPPPFQQYFQLTEDALSERTEEVVLFSGGLDSLGGAIQEAVINKRNIVLVTHKPTRKLERRYEHLRKLLIGYCQQAPPICIPVSINKEKSLSREYTQRSRSFLYAALGATIAQMVGLSRIRFYENGIVSFNLPFSAQVVGTKATRTTHPQAINNFSKVLSYVAGKQFIVENPFLWHTKKEVVEVIANTGCSDLIKFSMSCTHTWKITKLHTHCGTCSQCIDRRFAILAAGLEDADPAEAYKVDLLTSERSEGEPRTMLASYIETASEIMKITPVEFFSRYGEASRILRHLNDSADTTALKLFELYRRHAKHVTKVIDDGIAKYAPDIRERNLPSSCLLRLVCDAAMPEKVNILSVKEPPLSDYTFRKKGETWEVCFAGREDFILLPSKGAAYLHILLSHPRTAFSVTDLVFQVAKAPNQYALGNAGVASDRKALAAYRTRYEGLKEELKEAMENNDLGQQEKIQLEIGSLLAQIERDQGFGGRLRKEANDRDRLRKSFRAAIRRTIKEIVKYDKQFAEHLKSAIKCGWNPSYEPQQNISWDTC